MKSSRWHDIVRAATLLGMVFATTACKSSAPTAAPTPAEETAVPVPAGSKRLTVTPAQARSWGLPPVAFSFEYPATAELMLAKAGRRNPFYAMVTVYRGKKMSESVTLSHADLRGGSASNWGKHAPVLIAGLKRSLERQNSTTKISGIGEKSFAGGKHHQFAFTLTITDPQQGEPGRYRGLWVARLPEAGDRSSNGVTFTMNVREGSGSAVKSHDDFASKGLPGKIWQSFRFAR